MRSVIALMYSIRWISIICHYFFILNCVIQMIPTTGIICTTNALSKV